MRKLLLIDDDEKLGELLSQYLQRYDMQLQSVQLPSAGLQELQQHDYDLVILDIMLPEMDGFEVCKAIRQQNDIPIIMLTARGEVTDRVVGLELGADDYLPKPFEPRELVARIQTILKRTDKTTQRLNKVSLGALEIDRGSKTAWVNGQDINLSVNEFMLLELLIENTGTIMSRDQILNQLKGIDAEVFSRAVDITISRIRTKLKPLELIKTVRGSGYLFTGESQ